MNGYHIHCHVYKYSFRLSFVFESSYVCVCVCVCEHTSSSVVATKFSDGFDGAPIVSLSVSTKTGGGLWGACVAFFSVTLLLEPVTKESGVVFSSVTHYRY